MAPKAVTTRKIRGHNLVDSRLLERIHKLNNSVVYERMANAVIRGSILDHSVRPSPADSEINAGIPKTAVWLDMSVKSPLFRALTQINCLHPERQLPNRPASTPSSAPVPDRVLMPLPAEIMRQLKILSRRGFPVYVVQVGDMACLPGSVWHRLLRWHGKMILVFDSTLYTHLRLAGGAHKSDCADQAYVIFRSNMTRFAGWMRAYQGYINKGTIRRWTTDAILPCQIVLDLRRFTCLCPRRADGTANPLLEYLDGMIDQLLAPLNIFLMAGRILKVQDIWVRPQLRLHAVQVVELSTAGWYALSTDQSSWRSIAKHIVDRNARPKPLETY